MKELEQVLFFRQSIRKLERHHGQYTETEVHILILIKLINAEDEACTSKKLFQRLAPLGRTAKKKRLLTVIRKYIADQMIVKRGSKIYMCMRGNCFLSDLSEAIKFTPNIL